MPFTRVRPLAACVGRQLARETPYNTRRDPLDNPGRHTIGPCKLYSRAGMLGDVRRPDEISEAVCRLLGELGLRLDTGAAAGLRVHATFSPEVVVPTWSGLYASLRSRQ